MKKMKLFCGILIGLMIFSSCSSDDDNGNTSIENQNGFNYNGTFYSTQFAFVSDENTVDNTPSDISIILSNVNPFETTQSSGLNFVFFDFEAVNIETGTITTFPDYRILENAHLNDFDISSGNTVLDDTENGFMATSSSVTINSISDTNIDFDFSFTREDGETITGNYSGIYTDTSN
mgnify:FL=1